jgi:hypothetical protein
MPRDSSDDIKGKDPNCSFKSRHTSHVSSVLDFVIETGASDACSTGKALRRGSRDVQSGAVSSALMRLDYDFHILSERHQEPQ